MGRGWHSGITESEKFFFSLLRSGLWDRPVDYIPTSPIDWKEIYKIAVKQTVVPLIADGIDHFDGPKPEGAVQQAFINQVIQTERRNVQMNACVEKIFKLLSEHNIQAYLLKGQGVARAYLNPLHRQPGDIDLLLLGDNYQKAKELLIPLCHDVEKEITENLHVAMMLDDIEIELHGTIKTNTDKKLDSRAAFWMDRTVAGSSPIWNSDGILVKLPSYNFDPIFIFLHFFHHYISGGLGLRQICDWTMYLIRYSQFIDRKQLEDDITFLKMKDAWNGFAALSVGYLGCPKDDISFYSAKYLSKADKVVDYVLYGGNFGKYGNARYRNEPYLIRKAHSFLLKFKMSWAHITVFPKDTLSNLAGSMKEGFKAIFMDLFSRKK
jgi:hypothetical protein